MSRSPEALHCAASYLPQSLLVKRHTRDALVYKILADAKEVDRRQIFTSREAWRFHGRVCIDDYEPGKKIGSLLIDNGTMKHFSGYDYETDTLIARNITLVNQLHLGAFTGVQALRRDLAQAADYTGRHPQTYGAENIVGVTYWPLAKLALKAGFREASICDTTEIGERGINLGYHIFSALNGREATSSTEKLRPTMIYMPTEEFIERFSLPKSSAVDAMTEA
jgi:hypothetical protein